MAIAWIAVSQKYQGVGGVRERPSACSVVGMYNSISMQPRGCHVLHVELRRAVFMDIFYRSVHRTHCRTTVVVVHP